MRARLVGLLSGSDHRVARQTGWMAASLPVQVIGGVVQVAFTARILGPEGYGVLAVFAASTALLFGLLSMPGTGVITTHATRSLAAGETREAGNVLRFAVATAFGLGLVSYGLLAALALTAGGLLGVEQAEVPAMLMYGLTGLLMAAYWESYAVLRLADRLGIGTVVMVFGVLTRVGLIAVVWAADGGLWEIALVHVAGAAVSGGGMFLAGVFYSGRAGVPGLLRSSSVRVPADVIRFQFASFGQATVKSVSRQIDVLLIAGLANPTSTGLYRAARQIIDYTKQGFTPIAAAVQPEYSRRWYSGDMAGLRRLSRRATILCVGMAAAGYGLLVLLHEPIIRLVLGAEFADAAEPLLIFIPGAFLIMSITALYTLPVAAGRATPLLVAGVVAVVVQLSVIVLFVPTYGVTAAAWAYTIHALVLAAGLSPAIVRVLKSRVGGRSEEQSIAAEVIGTPPNGVSV